MFIRRMISRCKAFSTHRLTVSVFALGVVLFILRAANPSALELFSIPFTHVTIDSSPPRNQHAKTVGDINGDGFDDAITAGAVTDDGIFWYAYPTWRRHTIVPARVAPFATDMQTGDVDGDGDLDLIVPKRSQRQVYWYENPRPSGNPASDSWLEHFIGRASAHDLEIGDMNKDGRLDVVAREDSTKVFFQTSAGGWTGVRVNSRRDEGVAIGDIDGDGDLDLAINGYWLENPLPVDDPAVAPWFERVIDTNWPVQVGVHITDLNGDGRNDVLLAPAESSGGRLSWYESSRPTGPPGSWVEHVIDTDVSLFHTFKTADMDGDGDLDVVTAEMEQSSDPDAVSVYVNQGAGLSWTHEIVATTGSHNIRVTDFGLDGDFDIFGANWQGQQLLEMWRNDSNPRLDLDSWQRHVIDADKPWRSLLITTADLDRDGFEDVVTGGWWYRNPHSAGGAWVRNTLGLPLRNMATVYDFDRDGDIDVLGTEGEGSQPNDMLVWARNDDGAFTILDNIEQADGDFLQGAVAVPSQNEGRPEVMLSWHDGTSGVQRLTIPNNPSTNQWTWDEIANSSQDEDLSAGDIDRDGDIDILEGTQWFRNEGNTWSSHALGANGKPDRNRLADINRDGLLDAVVGFEAISVPGKLAWYEQQGSATGPWAEHVISTSVVGPMSLDAVDMDHDGDFDVVVGEHNLDSPASAALYVFENTDGSGGQWAQHTVYVGDEHHDGAHAVDIDNDGDMDLVSIGWGHARVVLYENKATSGVGQGPFVPAFELHQNQPNPFNPRTTIPYFVPPGGGNVAIRIYDVTGALVRTLVNGPQTSGDKEVEWNGLNDGGKAVASGVYFYRLTASRYKNTRKMVLLK